MTSSFPSTSSGHEANYFFQPETCNVVFIKSITFQTPSTSYPQISHDPFTSSVPTTSVDPFPTISSSNLAELPTCPVCLERMDDTTGLLTTQCQHVFHCACLQKWQSRSCPVCRHGNAHDFAYPPFGSGEEAMCSTCDSTEDLWICLICGNVGCGRYKGGHAKDHWKASGHNFALEIETQHIWDYASGDTGDWVHRLIRNKGDPKIEEMPQPAPESESHVDMVPREKYEAVQSQYTELIATLGRQKDEHFESLMCKLRKDASAATEAANRERAEKEEVCISIPISLVFL